MTAVSLLVIGRHGDRSATGGAPEVAERLDLPDLSSVRDGARRATQEVVWLLDDGVAPLGGALSALLDDASPVAVSVPVDARGRPYERLLGAVDDRDAAALLAAVGDRRVPLLSSPVLSLVAPRDLVADLEPPDPRRFGVLAGQEWTQRLFARAPGILVPGSQVRVNGRPARPSPRALARMVRSGAWRRADAVMAIGHFFLHS